MSESTNYHGLTPVLHVPAIEPLLPLWVERLGFSVVLEQPHDDRLGFVMLGCGAAKIMYQTFDSVRDDLPQFHEPGSGVHESTFIQVADLDDVARRLDGYPIEVGPRKTFYGSTEIWIRDPAGHVIGFAQFAEEPVDDGVDRA